MKKILVTDSLCIYSEHEQILKAAGYEIERLDKPKASEAELIEAVQGKEGYILGGVEQVTQKVIDAADQLKGIVFTGIGYKGFIPAWESATQKGIAIANIPDGPTDAVAEWSLAAALAMTRGLFELDRNQPTEFLTTTGLERQAIGIIALGRIGTRIAEMLQVFRPGSITYYSPHRHLQAEQNLNLSYHDLGTVLRKSDIVFLCVPDEAGEDFISHDQIALMKDRALLVSFAHRNIINAEALLEALKNQRIRAISDYPMDERFKSLPLSHWYSFNASNAFNTKHALKYMSDEATESLINLLTTGQDKNLVNPDYKKALR